jgi:hypothetical protein
VVGERAGRVLVLVVADDVGQMLDEVAAARDVEHLAAAADGEHRHVRGERRLEQRQLGAVPLGHDAERLLVRLLVVQVRIEVGAAREDQSVDGRERLRDAVLARRDQDGPAARLLDSPAHTRPGRARRPRPSRSSGRGHVRRDADERLLIPEIYDQPRW